LDLIGIKDACGGEGSSVFSCNDSTAVVRCLSHMFKFHPFILGAEE